MVDGSYKKLKALRDAAPDLSDFARYYQNKDFGSPVYQAAYLLYKAAHKEGEWWTYYTGLDGAMITLAIP